MPESDTPEREDDEEAEALRFAFTLAGSLPAFAPVLREAEAFWSPDPPRAGTLLGDLGEALASNFATLEREPRAAVFTLVEEGAARTPEDDYLSTAVCTGFLESLINQAETLEIWPEVETALGPASRTFADAYRSASFELTDAEQERLFLAQLPVDDPSV